MARTLPPCFSRLSYDVDLSHVPRAEIQAHCLVVLVNRLSVRSLGDAPLLIVVVHPSQALYASRWIGLRVFKGIGDLFNHLCWRRTRCLVVIQKLWHVSFSFPTTARFEVPIIGRKACLY